MRIETLADAESAARRGAEIIAEHARAAVHQRGRFVMALSGGRTPWMMLHVLRALDVPWKAVHILQVDERFVPAGHADRNFTHIEASLDLRGPDAPHMHPMPVDTADADLNSAARHYAQTIARVAGALPVLDLVHLGLGADGHTASLVPGDAVLDVVDRDVAVTGPYQGHRRMTLTFPVLERARQVLWLVTGSEKAEMLGRLLRRDPSILAGRVRHDEALVIADRAAAQEQGGDMAERRS